jgi:hypothetical protein
MRLRGAHHRHCNSKAFYMRNGAPVEVRIDGQIMVDTACFRKINPNYFGPAVIDLDHGFELSADYERIDYVSSDEASSEASSDNTLIVTSFELASETSPDQPAGGVVEQAGTTDEYLLICCPTVPGFSLKDKLWGKILPF